MFRAFVQSRSGPSTKQFQCPSTGHFMSLASTLHFMPRPFYRALHISWPFYRALQLGPSKGHWRCAMLYCFLDKELSSFVIISKLCLCPSIGHCMFVSSFIKIWFLGIHIFAIILNMLWFTPNPQIN